MEFKTFKSFQSYTQEKSIELLDARNLFEPKEKFKHMHVHIEQEFLQGGFGKRTLIKITNDKGKQSVSTKTENRFGWNEIITCTYATSEDLLPKYDVEIPNHTKNQNFTVKITQHTYTKKTQTK